MDASSIYSRRAGLDCSTAGDRSVIFDPVSGAATVLNPTGSLLWDRLASASDADSLAGFLRERFGISDIAARADVDAFLASLKEAGLAVESAGVPIS